MKKTYKIEVDCIGCAGKMERAVAKTEGVAAATLNFMTQKLIVEFTEGANPAEVMPRVRENCRKASHDCEIYL